MDTSWSDLQANAPVFLINLDRDSQRLEKAKKNIVAAGFAEANIQRVRGIDKGNCAELEAAWAAHGNPPLRDKDDFVDNKGKQAIALGHYSIWKEMVTNETPLAVIFEDDVFFHEHWDELAPRYWQTTPKDAEFVFMGSSFDVRSSAAILQTPVFCLHAVIVTLEGARKALDICLRDPEGTWTIDWMLRMHMMRPPQDRTLTWYVWNGTPFPDPEAFTSKMWQHNIRNLGLVFQDWRLGSNIDPELDVGAA
jgi:GR25 family glycosyltransferase involved in LPS biosynthesis